MKFLKNISLLVIVLVLSHCDLNINDPSVDAKVNGSINADVNTNKDSIDTKDSINVVTKDCIPDIIVDSVISGIRDNTPLLIGAWASGDVSNIDTSFITKDRFGSNLAWEFDGSPSNHVSINDNPKLHTPYTSISFWIYGTGSGHDTTMEGGMILHKESYWTGGYAVHFNQTNGKIKFRVRDKQTKADEITSNVNVSINSWHHVVCTFDGSVISITVDKVRKEASAKIKIMGNTDGDLTIGGSYWVDSNWQMYKGKIDDIQIYNGAIDSAKINELYHAKGYQL